MNEMIDRDLLIALPPPNDALAVFTSDGKIEPFLRMIRDKIDVFSGDASTASGRAAIKSMAHKISKSKAALEEVGKALADEQKSIPKKIDATRKHIKDTLDLWRDEVRAPVDAWEEKEAARIERHKHSLESLEAMATPSPDITAFMLKMQLHVVRDISTGDECEEYATEYVMAKDRAISAISAAIAVREKFEADQAELLALRAEAAERAQIAEQERIQRETAAREDAIRARAIEDAQITAKKAEQDALNAAAKREAQLIADRDAAERRATEAAQAAVRDQEAKAAKEAADALARERDAKHRGTINRAAVEALVAAGVDKDVAKQVVTLIAKKAVPAISIAY